MAGNSQAVRYTILASEHSGDDFVLWLRYLRKWVDESGHVFSAKDIAQIMKEKRISPLQKVMLSEAVTPGTPTNQYVIRLNGKVDNAEIRRRLLSGEEIDWARLGPGLPGAQ